MDFKHFTFIILLMFCGMLYGQKPLYRMPSSSLHMQFYGIQSSFPQYHFICTPPMNSNEALNGNAIDLDKETKAKICNILREDGYFNSPEYNLLPTSIINRKDPESVYKLFIRNALKGNFSYIPLISKVIFEYGSKGLKESYVKKLEEYKDKDSSNNCLYELGKILFYGELDGRKQTEQGLEYLDQAAGLNCFPAVKMLVKYYGTQKNREKQLFYINKYLKSYDNLIASIWNGGFRLDGSTKEEVEHEIKNGFSYEVNYLNKIKTELEKQ